jgi:hypothetical protein
MPCDQRCFRLIVTFVGEGVEYCDTGCVRQDNASGHCMHEVLQRKVLPSACIRSETVDASGLCRCGTFAGNMRAFGDGGAEGMAVARNRRMVPSEGRASVRATIAVAVEGSLELVDVEASLSVLSVALAASCSSCPFLSLRKSDFVSLPFAAGTLLVVGKRSRCLRTA